MSQPTIVLYGNVGTPYTEKVLGALRLKRLAFDLVQPTRPEDLRRWNPETGLLPVIVIDGERIHDSPVILDRLEALFPETPLISKDPKTAREQRRLELWVSETFTFYMVRWIGQKFGRQASGPTHDEEGNAIGLLSRMGMIGEDGYLKPEAFDTSDGGPGEEFDRRVGDLETMLGDRPYFYSDEISRADLAAYGALLGMYTGRYANGRKALERFPKLVAFCDRVRDAIDAAG